MALVPLFNPLDYPISLAVPERLTDVSAWHGHIPFAFSLIAMHKPQRFVELGVHRGDSYCAFLQAVKMLGLDTKCAGIDIFTGDVHAGLYDGSAVYDELRTYHAQRYANFSQLIVSTFDNALSQFADDSIDLLHIDGFHSYEAVSHDFHTWLPKLSSNAIVLFHDICVDDPTFGVKRFWTEVVDQFPQRTFEFHHSSGLGVLFFGQEAGLFLENSPAQVRMYFSILGSHMTLYKQYYALGGA